MSGNSREESYEPLRGQGRSSDTGYKPQWDNLESQPARAPAPLITWQYKLYVSAMLLCNAGFIAVFAVVLSTGKSWKQLSTSDKIWLIIAPIYTIVTIFTVTVFIRAWQKAKRVSRA